MKESKMTQAATINPAVDLATPKVDIGRIRVKDSPRRLKDPDGIQALADTIADIGMIEPLSSRRWGDAASRTFPTSFPCRIGIQGVLEGHPRPSNPLRKGRSRPEARVRLHSAALLRPRSGVGSLGGRR
jgi:hypothetical protein